MAVSIAFYSVVVRNETIEARFRRVGFMAFDDVQAFVAFLERSGMPRNEMAVTRQDHGLIEPCEWLETGAFDGYSIAWLAGTTPETLVIPEAEMGRPKAQRISREELEATHEKVGVENGVEAFRNRETGAMVYVGRSSPTEAASAEQ